jgi:protein gp37
MGDPFHPKVPYEFLSRMFATMAIAERHTFLVLTKRPDYLAQLIEAVRIGTPWPLPNVLLGVTVEDQRRADERMPHLMILAAMGWRTWVSCEPALGAVDWERWLMRNDSADDGRAFPSGRVSWLVCGGETGPGARPMRIEWASTAAKQCRDAGVPFFFKGWGDWFPDEQLVEERRQRPGSIMLPWPVSNRQIYHFDGGVYYRVGKKLAGRLLDGVEHNELPGKD